MKMTTTRLAQMIFLLDKTTTRLSQAPFVYIYYCLLYTSDAADEL